MREREDDTTPPPLRDPADYLSPRQLAAARALVGRVRAHVPAELVAALLFGSRARRRGRPDSDVDLLFVFRRLPLDREPQAGIAEELADATAAEWGVPVTAWSVSLPDLRRGERTPMLVDALDDGVPLWPHPAPDLRVAFTPHDAVFCTAALLQRVAEGSEEVGEHRRAGDAEAAARRLRDDLVRLLTAALLLVGETRPRRAECVRRFAERFAVRGAAPRVDPALLRWAAASYGPPGAEDRPAVPPPPGGMAAAACTVDALRAWVAAALDALRRRTGGTPGGAVG